MNTFDQRKSGAGLCGLLMGLALIWAMLAGFAAAEELSAEEFGICFGIASLVLIVAVLAAGRANRAQQRRRSTPLPQYVANQAMKRAQYAPDGAQPYLWDIGLLAYHGDDTPDVYRRRSIPGSTAQLRPYVMLRGGWSRLLSARPAVVRFELEDPAKTLRFAAEKTTQFRMGPTFITPDTWLPFDESSAWDGRWSLRVSLDGQPAGLHPFRVKPVYKTELSAYIDADGEIDENLGELALTDEPISLDDLLKGRASITVRNAQD